MKEMYGVENFKINLFLTSHTLPIVMEPHMKTVQFHTTIVCSFLPT
jgi:hypothetical protein